MKKIFYCMAVIPLLMACAEDATEGATPETPSAPTETVAPLSHSTLAAFPSSQSRVSTKPATKAVLPGELSLYAEIANPSKTEGSITGFVREENGRHLSATCVYYNEKTQTYYVTYHMQGNNYNSKQKDAVSGFVESFTLDENGKPQVGKIFMASDPSNLDFDFNHLFFDDLTNDTYIAEDGERLIVVGHKWEVPKDYSGTEPYTGDNTAAIIGLLDLESATPTIDYRTITTGEKIYDAEGHSLGKEDAADANAVIRSYKWYYVATRKGFAALNALSDKLFTPTLDYEGNDYFIKTPGSAKFVFNNPGQYSHMAFLYLTEDTPEGFDYETSSPARIANFFVHGGDNGILDQTSGSFTPITNVREYDINSYADQLQLPNNISPVDGKNVLFMPEYSEYFACLGTGGLYVKNAGSWKSGIVKFGDHETGKGRPVNGVYVDGGGDNTGGEYHNGYVYVANGRCLTILDRATLEVVAEYSADIDEDASANYIHVTTTGPKNMEERRTERTIVVAYGQAGVKVFKFNPPTKW